MTRVLAVTLASLLTGCAEMMAYDSVVEGPRAKVRFVSPYLEDRFLALDDLGLLVLEPDGTCSFTVKGNVPLSTGTGKTTYVPADRRAYFRIKQSSHEFMGASSKAQIEFSFVPEDGAEYTIEHIDTPAGFRMKYYRHGHEGKRVPIEVQGFDACTKT